MASRSKAYCHHRRAPFAERRAAHVDTAADFRAFSRRSNTHRCGDIAESAPRVFLCLESRNAGTEAAGYPSEEGLESPERGWHVVDS